MNIQEAKLVIYANDTIILVTDNDKENLQAKLSSVMKQLEVWFLNNDLIVDTTKTVAMSFHLCQSKPPYKPNISKTCLKQNLKGPEHFSAKARFPFNQGTLHIKIFSLFTFQT
jgi:hypothetical protein